MPRKRKLELLNLTSDSAQLAKKKKILAAASSRGAYDMYYDPTPLLDFIRHKFFDPSEEATRATLILLLRCVHLMRSCDIGGLLPTLFVQPQPQGPDLHYIKYLAKGYKWRVPP